MTAELITEFGNDSSFTFTSDAAARIAASAAGVMDIKARALVCGLDAIASEIGRLRRRADSDSSLEHLADRLAAHLDVLDAMLQPAAGELVAAGFDVDQALEIVDDRARHLRGLLGSVRR